MMKQNLEADIQNFFNQIDSQTDSDQKQTLRLLLDKYIHLTKSDMMMDKHDLESIIAMAKAVMVEKTMPVTMGKNKRRVHPDQLTTLCVIEATISHLNKTECLKRLPKFDYREDSF
jgi:hypothetical protein